MLTYLLGLLAVFHTCKDLSIKLSQVLNLKDEKVKNAFCTNAELFSPQNLKAKQPNKLINS